MSKAGRTGILSLPPNRDSAVKILANSACPIDPDRHDGNPRVAVQHFKTFQAKANFKPGEVDPVQRRWYVVDGEDRIVGRLARDIAVILMGKNKPTYTPHVDTGDFVIVVNAEKVHFTGQKWDQRTYAWYTGYPGQKTETARTRLEKRPTLILREAVRRMLPKNKLGRQMLDKLKLYVGPDHPHQAQQPEPRELGRKELA